MNVEWPNGKRFAFTIFDDSDNAVRGNVEPVYAFLAELGFRTTKSIWPIRGSGSPICGGDTVDNPRYREWLLALQTEGFEIGFHNATYHTSARASTVEALDRFHQLFGQYPKTMANHASNGEAVYWGPSRVSGLNRLIYLLLTGLRTAKTFRGHVPGDPLFWGDICRDKIRYVRNFVFAELNTLKACPQMPYYDPARPFVNHWFASTEAPSVKPFVKACSDAAVDELAENGGACILYTHLANGFWESEDIQPDFRRRMQRLSGKNGWFVPVGELLDYILEKRGPYAISKQERRRLERKWLLHKVRVRRS